MDEALRADWDAGSPEATVAVDVDEGEGIEPEESVLESAKLGEPQLAELVALAVEGPQRLLPRLRRLARAEALSLEEVLFEYVRPVAQQLGQCWLDDTLSFGAVTVGADALQRAVAALGHEAEGPLLHRELVVLTAAPGEQHVLPLHLLSEAIRAEGWSTHVEAQMELEDLLDLVSVEEVAMVGVTCKDPERLADLADHAPALREASIAPLELALGGAPELEPHAQAIGFTYYSSVRAVCQCLARRVIT